MRFPRPAWILLVVLLAGCRSSFDVERRETPLHVWLVVPDLARSGGTVEALVQVGPHAVVRGPVHFDRGRTTVRLPSLYVPARPYAVRAWLRGGALRAETTIDLEQESWLVVRAQGGSLTLEHSEDLPEVDR